MNFSVTPTSKARRQRSSSGVSLAAPRFAIFAIPKPFADPRTAIIQKNAILSWTHLSPDAEVILMGDEPGVAEFAAEHGLRHVPQLRRNVQGTPLLSDAFARVRQWSNAPVLMYCNCDVILLRDLTLAIEAIRSDRRFKSFLAFGRREDVPVDRYLDLNQSGDLETLFQLRQTFGRRAPIVCKEYFIFSRDLFQNIPDFCVGRGNWDNWMVAHARSRGIPVINVSKMVSAVHQTHDYRHLKTSRWGCYVTCQEAKENQRLAGGRHVARGCVATWNLTYRGIVPNWGSWLNKDFWLDLPRFLRMLVKLPFER